jgi:hypothetical protein
MTKTVRMRMKDAADAYCGCDAAGAPLRTLIGEFPEPGLRTERDLNGALRIIRDDGSLAATFPGSSIVAEQEDDALRVYLMTTEPVATAALGDAPRKSMFRGLTPTELQAQNRQRHARIGDHSSEVDAAVVAARKAGKGVGPAEMQRLNARLFPRVGGMPR